MVSLMVEGTRRAGSADAYRCRARARVLRMETLRRRKGEPMMRQRYEFIESEAARQVRLHEAQLMREAAAGQAGCRRCGAPLDDADDAVCDQCQYNDLQSQEDSE